jgi:hypothetical protein
VYVSEEDLVEPRLDIYHLHSMTGMPARTIYYYVHRRLVPKAIGSGPAARYNYDGHTIGELLGFAEGVNPERGIGKMRRFFHRRAGESCDGADNLTRVEIREGLELFVSPTYLPRAAAKVDDLTRALDEILEIDDGT